MWKALDYVDVARFCNQNGAHATTIDAVRIGLGLDPGNAMLHVYRAAAYDEFGRSAEAIADCERAIELAPRSHAAVLALITLALVRDRIGDAAGAFAAAQTAISIDPADREAHAVLGTLLAWHGAYPAAWPELECHWLDERIAFMQRFTGLSEWDGADIAGGRLLLVHGQGIGDMIQMLRYVPRLRERGIEVVIESPASMLPIVRATLGVGAVFAKDAAPRESYDAYARMISLARFFNEDAAPEHARVPYVTADDAPIAAWAARLGPRTERTRAGIVWAGNPYHLNDRRRSIPIAELAPLARVSEVEWISLQVGPRANDAAPPGLTLRRFGDAAFGTFAETAALIANLDLVIAADTAVAHLAGAMGKPVWVMLPWRCDWRWRPAAALTPWYPTMRLLHADDPTWAAPVAAVVAALRQAAGDTATGSG